MYVASVVTVDNGQIMVSLVTRAALGGVPGGQIMWTPQASTATPLTVRYTDPGGHVQVRAGAYGNKPVLSGFLQISLSLVL